MSLRDPGYGVPALVIGLIVLSGCITATSTSPGIVTTASDQILDETRPVPPAPGGSADPDRTLTTGTPVPSPLVNGTVPASPAPAMEPASGTVREAPRPSTLATAAVSGGPVLTRVTTLPVTTGAGPEKNRVQDAILQPELFLDTNSTGGLFINIRAGGSVDGLKVFIAREGTDVSPIEYRFLPDRTVVEGENQGYLPVRILPDGRSGLIRLRPGSYTAYLPNWNGGEPEEQSFTIREESITPIWFAGFAASSGGGCGC